MDDKRRTAWSLWADQPLPLRISVIVAAGVLFIVIWWWLPPLLYTGTSDANVNAIAATRTGLLAGLLGVGALGTLWINSHNAGLNAEALRVSQENFRLAQDNFRLSEENQKHTVKDATERRVTELYTKAADQVGSDKAPVRLAGLYALERLAQDNPSQRQTIVDVLCTYLQMPYTPPGAAPFEPCADDAARSSGGDATAAAAETRVEQERQRFEKHLHEHEKRAQEQRVRTTAQRILLRHTRSGDETLRWTTVIDLSGADLSGADLDGAELTGAYLTEANLTGAKLSGAGTILSGATLLRANLTRATLSEAKLYWAHLDWANLSEAKLDGADLTDAHLRKADLTGADLKEANLTGAYLNEADLSRASLAGANLAGARLYNCHLAGANLSGANLSGAIWGNYAGIWPEELRATINAASEYVDVGLFRIRREFEVPRSPTPGPAWPTT